MNATSSAQKTVSNPSATTQKSGAKPAEDTSGFSNIMSKLKEKNKKIQAEAAIEKQVEAPKVKAAPKGVDLSFLGEMAESQKQNGGVKLSDILAEISHATVTPKGTEVINFKNILAASNDDPQLLNVDLLNLLPKEKRGLITTELLNGVKQEVKGRLGRIVPQERIPTTLKGMLETAIRLDVKVDNIKLETIEGNKAAKELLTLFNLNEKALKSLPQARVAMNKQDNLVDKKVNEKKLESSPLQKALEKQADNKKSDIVKAEPIKNDVVKTTETKAEPKTTVAKGEAKLPAAIDLKNASKAQEVTTKEAVVAKSSEPKVNEIKPDNVAKIETAVKTDNGEKEEVAQAPVRELTGEAARRLKKKDTVRERVDLDIGKNIETKKNEITQDAKQTAIVQNEANQKNGTQNRVDLPLAKLETGKEDKKADAKRSSKEEQLQAADTKLAKLDSMQPKQAGDKTQAASVNNTVSEEMAQAEETAEGVKHESTTHVTKNEATQKAEAQLSAKIVEGKQLASQLSSDIKEAMENYKPPFTKLTMKLRPEKLGEIDVMMVQRGNNVHINLSSNSAALSLLQQQSGDLKAALADLGLGDASMKFTQSDSQRQQQQQQQHSTSERYQEMAKLEENVDMLELIVPKYG